MTALLGTDLGCCDVFLADGSRCLGRLVVDGEVGGVVEATCDVCGSVAGCPVRRLNEPAEREESWWQK